MNIIDHSGFDYSSGVRCLILTGRNKDDISLDRKILRITKNKEHFQKIFSELLELSKENERIYCTAGARSLKSASREFKLRQLDADYSDNPLDFYENLTTRWTSCLMKPISQRTKIWMFDIDTVDEKENVDEELLKIENELGFSPILHKYKTKNGHHYLCKPFNKSLLGEHVIELLKPNALMLLGY